ncbi:MAG: hypothetical protein HZB86_06640 [Deltaproteobacteria bacterium]|nr:hypothetical protein [Deltaproteobacteria bacterium]
MNCGREPGGKHVDEHGECPAPTAINGDGVNGGVNGGRCCWAIAGTLCFGAPQGTSARKFQDCMDCGFFWAVADEEEDFTSSVNILRKAGEDTDD